MEITEELLITLTIYETIAVDSGEFTITISNDFGSSSCTVDITIDYEPPSFTTPLRDNTVTVGDTTTLQCTSRGLPQPQTKWLVSGLELFESDKYHIERKESVSLLEISNVTIDDGDMEYTCCAFNAVGEAVTTARVLPQGWLLYCHSMAPHCHSTRNI